MGRWHEFLRRFTPAVTPDELLGVSLDTTTICNLRCTICSLDENHHDKGVMTMETFACLSDDLPMLRQMAFSSSAEPLLNPHLPDMLSRAKRTNGLVTSLTTNGTLLDEPIARALIERGLDALEISIDGASEATYEAVRTGARLEQVLQNVRRLSMLKRQLGSATPHISIRFVLLRDNAHELEAMFDLALDLEVHHLVVNGLEPYSTEMAVKVLYGEEDDLNLEQRFLALAKRADGMGARIDLPSLWPEPIDNCTLINHSCIVLFDGTVVPCSPLTYERPFFWLGRRHEHGLHSFGNIHERRLLEIWHSEEYSAWRRALRNGTVHEECRTCLKRAGVLCPLKHWQWLSAQKRGFRARIGRKLNAFFGNGC